MNKYETLLIYTFSKGTPVKFILHSHSHLIVLEEDLIASSDFFTLFIAAAPLLEQVREPAICRKAVMEPSQDHSLFCISAWNDNGEIGVAWLA